MIVIYDGQLKFIGPQMCLCATVNDDRNKMGIKAETDKAFMHLSIASCIFFRLTIQLASKCRFILSIRIDDQFIGQSAPYFKAWCFLSYADVGE